ncbi:hypothetical protein [Isoptericola croceus]|uniref:hypothetical protein n=1 Tax=Isoptericola croceus TaxID=3031406 RepID=UPI0023F95643|nr:hypothetical protein [Isoptericola croceus]
MSRMLRTAALAAGAGLVAALAGPGALAVTAPSAEASGEGRGAVALSVDGQVWSEDMDVSLLDPAQVWVPGDVERTSLLVRHDGTGEARGTVSVSVGGHPELAEAIDVRVRAGGQPWRAGGTAPLVVGQGDELPVELEVAFMPEAGNATQGGPVRLDVAVLLAGDDPGAVRPPVVPGGALPRTGVDVWFLLVLAAAATAGGLAVRGGVRRREGGDA